MGYTTLEKDRLPRLNFPENSLPGAALAFIRSRCEGLRFDPGKQNDREGTSRAANQIPCNMEKDIDRLCLENALRRFLRSGKKEDAFDVYFCYLDMFVGNYEKTRRMIELLSEYENNGSSLLMKHRDHYSHSVYVFALGLAIYQTNSIYRDTYKAYYGLTGDHAAACHYLQYWGLTSLFHDIGYPFELPFEQVSSYFEVANVERKNSPYVAYQNLDPYIAIKGTAALSLQKFFPERTFRNTNELYAYLLVDKLGAVYHFTEETMLDVLNRKPTRPEDFNCFMDHAYFSSAVLFQKLFGELGCPLELAHLDALTAILMHNSLYKFSIAFYKKTETNQPFKAALHPLAFMLMLCDELQCWDRTAYGRNTRSQLHPMDCTFDLSDNKIKATYLFDKNELPKINEFKDAYIAFLQGKTAKAPKMKAYADMFCKVNGKSDTEADIESIVDLSEIKLTINTGLTLPRREGRRSLSDSNFLNLYNFAVVLNGRWAASGWKEAMEAGQEEAYIRDTARLKAFSEQFKALSLEYKLSNINQAKAFAGYLNAIGCFYTDKPVDFALLEKFTAEELQKIGPMEHKRWLQEHYDMGWTYGTPIEAERDLLRRHSDMVPDYTPDNGVVSDEAAAKNYARLSKAEQDKDTDPMECMLTLLKMYDGVRFYRLN